MTYKQIIKIIEFNRERIDELNDRLSSTDSSDVRKACIKEMMWRAEEIGKLDNCNRRRLITNLENFRKRIGF